MLLDLVVLFVGPLLFNYFIVNKGFTSGKNRAARIKKVFIYLLIMQTALSLDLGVMMVVMVLGLPLHGN